MITLDLKITPESEIYRGCQFVDGKRKGQFYLATPEDSGKVIVKANLLEWVKKIENPQAKELTITGAAPIWVYILAVRFVASRFKKMHYTSGKGSMEMFVNAFPGSYDPPDDFDSEPT